MSPPDPCVDRLVRAFDAGHLLDLIQVMDERGGGFFRGIATALRSADRGNLLKVFSTWPEELCAYLDVAERRLAQNDHL